MANQTGKKWIAAVGTAVFVLLTAYSVAYERGALPWIAGAWAVVPPMWFLCEYRFFGPEEGGLEWERFKYNQELARNLWAGLAAVLGALYLKGLQ